MAGRIKVGERYGRLITLEDVGKDNNGYRLWRCKCDCGNETIVPSRYLGKGTWSCGCYAKERAAKRLTKHGKRFSRIYSIHKTMIQRCGNPNAHEYENYGGRGITVCAEWKDFETFDAWASNNGYKDNLTLDRIDPNGNYEPSNCRFVSMKIQQRNRRNNVRITHNGETRCMAEWAEIAGIAYGTFVKRIQAGWSMERAMQPVNR